MPHGGIDPDIALAGGPDEAALANEDSESKRDAGRAGRSSSVCCSSVFRKRNRS